MKNKHYIKIELSTAQAFSKGMVCRCNTCGSVFAKMPDYDYCPICSYRSLDKEYKQELIENTK